jgi:hypothetical protein
MAYKRPHKKMRKNILMLLVFIAINTSAQTFELTARGFVDSTKIEP